MSISGLHIGLAALFAFSLAAGTCRGSQDPAHPPRPTCWSGRRCNGGVGLLAGCGLANLHRSSPCHGGCRRGTPASVHPQFGGFTAGRHNVRGCNIFPRQVASAGWLSFSAVWLICLLASGKPGSRSTYGWSGCPSCYCQKALVPASASACKASNRPVGRDDASTDLCFRRGAVVGSLDESFAVPIFGAVVVPCVLFSLGVYAVGLPHWID